MMPETIGTIGSTQGVKASSRPEAKNAPIISRTLPLAMSRARPDCSETYSPPPEVLTLPSVTLPPASGSVRSKVLVIGE